MNLFLKKFIIYASIAAIIVAVVVLERKPIAKIANFVKNYSSNQGVVLEEFKQEIFTSPLRSKFSGSAASLSPSNIIELTNQERVATGLSGLKENNLLNQAAMMKVQDIFNRQYFEHISPDGHGPGYLADVAKYEYVVVGENLALGTFKNDASLVKAWMDSLGHRENILNARYSEIGVAVGQGFFDGERMYVAVQEFGKPSSACPSVGADERLRIESDQAEADRLNDIVVIYKNTLEAMPHNTTEENSAYNAKVAEYNATVSKYNTAVDDLRAKIEVYNRRVRDFNTCATK